MRSKRIAEDPEELFTLTFLRTLNGFSLITSFREVAGVATDYAVPALVQRAMATLQDLDGEGVFDKLFIMPDGKTRASKEKFMAVTGGIKEMARTMVAASIKSHSFAVDAASLVFAHSILDAAAYSYCRVASLLVPQDWEGAVGERQVLLKHMKGCTYDSVLQEKVADYVGSLERKSLLKKLDSLHTVCRPSDGWSALGDYAYDRERLKRLDETRHDVVHGGDVVWPLPKGDDDLWYIQKTCTHLMVLVNQRYKVKMNTAYLSRAYGTSGGHTPLMAQQEPEKGTAPDLEGQTPLS